MVKIIIDLRDYDNNNNKVDNSKTVEKITVYVHKFLDCEAIEIQK